MIAVGPKHRFDHWLPKALGVEAITLAPFVFYAKPRWETADSTIVHEKVHLLQVRMKGWIRFYTFYLWQYFKNRVRGMDSYSAYRAISFEQEAFEIQNKWELGQRMRPNLEAK